MIGTERPIGLQLDASLDRHHKAQPELRPSAVDLAFGFTAFELVMLLGLQSVVKQGLVGRSLCL